jgi:segregation and condensation protein A
MHIASDVREHSAEPESPYTGVRVAIDAFSGPLDLLLHLIQRDEIDIYDIPIAHITAQYLGHLELMQELDLEVAGEFIVMAATLIRIKAQLLLPTPVSEETGEEIDPREDLVRRLVEYRKYKAAAEVLHEHEARRLARFHRPSQLPDLPPEEHPIGDVTVFDLVSLLKKMLERLPEETSHDVELEPVHLEDRMEILRARLLTQREVSFTEYVQDVRTRMGLVVSFMAILELMKLGEVMARQENTFGEIVLARRTTGGSGPEA